MTTQQANLIREMCENPFDIKRFDKAHAELLQSCSDTEPCLVPTPQPTVTISATSSGTFSAALRSPRWMVASSTPVARHSDSHCGIPLRTLLENCTTGRSNIACVSHTPITPPQICAAT